MISVNLSGFSAKKIISHIVLNNENIKAVNTEEFPENVKEYYVEYDVLHSDGTVDVKLEKHSWNTVLIEL